MLSCLRKVYEVKDQRCGYGSNKAQDDAGDNCDLEELIAVLLGFLKTVCTKLVADDDDASACDRIAEAGYEVFYDSCDSVSGCSIRSQVSHDYSDHGEAESPEKGIQKVGKSVLRKPLS